MKIKLNILLFLISLPLLVNAQEPSLQELKERTIKEMKKIKPDVFVEDNLWRVNVVPNTYKKTPTLEQWQWTFENITDEKGEYYLHKFLFENKTDSVTKCTPNKSLGYSINIKMTPERTKESQIIIRSALKKKDPKINSVSNIAISKQYPAPLKQGTIYHFTATIVLDGEAPLNVKGSFRKQNSDDQFFWHFLYKTK